MHHRISWLLTAALGVGVFAGTSSVQAETVTLESGELIEGRIEDLGDRIRVHSESGVSVTVHWRDVDVIHRHRTASELYAARRARTADEPHALFELALWAERAGLHAERKACLEAVLELDPEHEAARSALEQQKADGAWLAGEKLLRAKGFVRHDGGWVLAEEAERASRLEAGVKELSEGEVRVEDLLQRAVRSETARKLALEALSGLDPDDVQRPALRSLRRGEPQDRALAASVLGRVGDEAVLRPLIYHAIMDREAEVRSSAVAALDEIEHADKLKPFIRALDSDVPVVRMNAAEALGAFGGADAVQWLIRRVLSTGGIGTRNHFTSLNQISYVSDFDVEIAQASQIGDPIVGVIREGVILDTRVTGVVEEYTVVERRVLRNALVRATGHDYGEDGEAWARWWQDEGREELARADAAE